MKIKRSERKGTIKNRLIVLPLIVVFLVTATIGVVSSYFLKKSMLAEMESNGVFLISSFIDNLNDNQKALKTINELLDEKLISSAKVVVGNEENVNSDLIKSLAEKLNMEQIHWYSDGKIIHSNVDGYIGWTAEAGHPVHDFMVGSENELVEDIRQDSESKDYLKFAYMKTPEGDFIQLGINANKVQELTDNFNYQSLIDEISNREDLFYGMFIGKDLKILAHNDKEEIGTVADDEGSKIAAVEGKPFIQDWHYEEKNVDVLDISYPVVIEGEHLGAMSVGISLESLNEDISRNIFLILSITIVAFIILGFILYNASGYVVKIANRLKDQMKYMQEGDFSVDVSEDLMSKNDELGEISKAVSIMQNSLKDVIRNVIETSQNLAASSEELTATSQQSAIAGDEVARAIEEIANGATEQARDTEIGVASISELGDIVMNNNSHMENLNSSAEKVNSLKNEGLDIIKTLVENTNTNSEISKDVQEVIINTSKSAEEIANASEMIKSIAEQTNLLALNAAIEAARAGEAGRGFAVVADEIRELAEQSNKFTGEINDVVNNLIEKTSIAVKTMERAEEIVNIQSESVNITNNKFVGIAEALEDMKNIIAEVSSSSEDINSKKEDIIGRMESLSAISEENAAGTEEASASVEEQMAAVAEIANSSDQLAQMAEKLNQDVMQFKI